MESGAGHNVRFWNKQHSPGPMPDSISSTSDSAHTKYTSSAPNVALRSPCSQGY